MKQKLRTSLFFSALIILSAQLNINFITSNFRISIAVIVFAAISLLINDFLTLPSTFIIAAGVFISRVIVDHANGEDFYSGVLADMPEIAFYICYGVLLTLMFKLVGKQTNDKFRLIFLLVIIDYISNFTELFLRLGNGALNETAQSSIILVAIIRSLLFLFVLFILDHYHFLLLRREHQERYQRLIDLISKLNSEMVWMRKNTAQIEDTMKTSYQLYQALRRDDPKSEKTKLALSVSRDIHEVKKEYLLILRGLSEALDNEAKYDNMYLNELLDLVKEPLLAMANEKKVSLKFVINCPDNPYITSYYAVLSIFRNLCTNALEACNSEELTITINEIAKDEAYLFEIIDNGPGIPEESIATVFQAGYSTKINFTTGEINRGLGLNIVEDLVLRTLGGKLRLTSVPGETKFSIEVPISNLHKSSFESVANIKSTNI